MTTAFKLVLEAAEDAGYKAVVYHGTNRALWAPGDYTFKHWLT